VIVSGYPAILLGRTRATEDVDAYVERITADKFREFYNVAGDFTDWRSHHISFVKIRDARSEVRSHLQLYLDLEEKEVNMGGKEQQWSAVLIALEQGISQEALKNFLEMFRQDVPFDQAILLNLKVSGEEKKPAALMLAEAETERSILIDLIGEKFEFYLIPLSQIITENTKGQAPRFLLLVYTAY